MSKGERANEPVVMYGHREVVLESTDDTSSWGPGHAEWKCLVCGLTGQTQDPGLRDPRDPRARHATRRR
jgi:hypothetical protein